MENVQTLNKQTKPKIRLDYLDIAKFIAIFLVILGHTTANLARPMYRVILYTFHMPFFFMVSGVVIRRHRHEYNLKHWITFLRKNILALVVPYLIWGLIYGPFNFTNVLHLFYASWEQLGTIGTLTSLWFLPCLFTSRIIVEVIMMISTYFEKINRHLFAAIVGVIFLFGGMFIPHPTEIGVPWCADIAVVASGFILIGYSLKDIFAALYKKPIWLHLIFLVVSLGIFVFGILIQGDEPYLAIMAKAAYGDTLIEKILFVTNAFSGSGIILSISIIITKLFENHKNNVINRFMLWVGKSTIGIYLLHKNFLAEVCMSNFEKWGVELPNLGFALIGSVIAFIYSVLLVFIIDRYVPQLFGKFPSKKIIVVKEEDFNEPKLEATNQ